MDLNDGWSQLHLGGKYTRGGRRYDASGQRSSQFEHEARLSTATYEGH